jgi:hypothetical protein
MLSRHGFTYAGHTTSDEGRLAIESHYFLRSDCTIEFNFAHNIDYGANAISIGDPFNGKVGAGRFENWLYFHDYPKQLNAQIESGMNRDSAIALTLDGHIDYAAALYSLIRSNGHRLPTSDDKAQVRAQMALRQA